MKSVSLIPYCPLPCTSGARAIFLKHISFLQSLGEVTVASADSIPVGGGWSKEAVRSLRQEGVNIVLRKHGALSMASYFGVLYACFFKLLRFEKAFGHSNWYHRYAFPEEWWFNQTLSKDVAEIHYSYWARLPCACSKVVILHDLWSDLMWEGKRLETKELSMADLVVTVSMEDKQRLLQRGLSNVHWSPPRVRAVETGDSSDAVIVGSANRHNIEGVRWLGSCKNNFPAAVSCYGSISKHVKKDDRFTPHGYYENVSDPYMKSGIVLIPTSSGTGLQIKGIEALAHGKTIIARKGAMRGLPTEEPGWIEVETPEEMVETLAKLIRDRNYRKNRSEKAKAYHRKYLSTEAIDKELLTKYRDL